jgi:methylthioribulose-1-phosphate dehydratase
VKIDEILKTKLTETILFLAQKGWSPGTGGNFSVVSNQSPLELFMSPSSIDKTQINQSQIITVDSDGKVIKGHGKSSAETAIHLVLCKKYGAKSVLHTHSIWNTSLSRKIKPFESITLSGYEMLKALGESTHDTVVEIPVFPNTQDIDFFAQMLDDEYEKYKSMKAFLMAGHGLYCWGDSIESAKRHTEAVEFLLECYGVENFIIKNF